MCVIQTKPCHPDCKNYRCNPNLGPYTSSNEGFMQALWLHYQDRVLNDETFGRGTWDMPYEHWEGFLQDEF